MPITKTTRINEKSTVAVWDITESVEVLRILVADTSNVQLPDKSITNPTSQAEWIAGRLLLAFLVEDIGHDYPGIYKDEYGKPHLKDTGFHTSLSHDFPLVAAIICQGKAVGIDIERPGEKLRRVAPRFLSEEEQRVCGDDLDLLCIHWCAKEALYKQYGKKKLNFKEDLSVRIKGREILGVVMVNGVACEYELKIQKVFNHFLVFTK